jgi:hypothetical protein
MELNSLIILDGIVCLLYLSLVVNFQQASSACISPPLSLLNFWILCRGLATQFSRIAQGVFWTRNS